MNTFDYWFNYIVRNGEFDKKYRPFGYCWQIKAGVNIYHAYFHRAEEGNRYNKIISIAFPMVEGSNFFATMLCEKDNFNPNNPLLKNLTSLRKMV